MPHKHSSALNTGKFEKVWSNTDKRELKEGLDHLDVYHLGFRVHLKFPDLALYVGGTLHRRLLRKRLQEHLSTRKHMSLKSWFDLPGWAGGAGRIFFPSLGKIFTTSGSACLVEFIAQQALTACCVCKGTPLTACSGIFIPARAVAAETPWPVTDAPFTLTSLSFA